MTKEEMLQSLKEEAKKEIQKAREKQLFFMASNDENEEKPFTDQNKAFECYLQRIFWKNVLKELTEFEKKEEKEKEKEKINERTKNQNS